MKKNTSCKNINPVIADLEQPLTLLKFQQTSWLFEVCLAYCYSFLLPPSSGFPRQTLSPSHSLAPSQGRKNNFHNSPYTH